MTTILELVPSAEVFKYAAGTSGGEWQGPCPWCGGRDRFSIWPEHTSGAIGGRYACRQCGKNGDAIQFLRELEGMSYPDACKALQVDPKPLADRAHSTASPRPWTPKPATKPVDIWQVQAARFVTECAANMLQGSEGLAYAHTRGLTPDTVVRLRIGWNPEDRWESRESWGLPPEKNDKGNPKKVWLPAGLVLPTRRKSGFTAVKVRRSAWTPEDTMPKYVAVAGSVPGLALGSGVGLPVVVVESEIDAVLVWQEARELVNAVALGTVGGKPDEDMAAHLRTAPRILVALDFDEAGKKAAPWWAEHFPQAERWPVAAGKDVGDMAKTPGLIRAWLEAASLAEPACIPWPEPEPGPIETVTPAGKYALLFAMVSHFGAGLTKDAGGGLALALPASVPPAPAQAIRDGFAELQAYVQGRVQ